MLTKCDRLFGSIAGELGVLPGITLARLLAHFERSLLNQSYLIVIKRLAG